MTFELVIATGDPQGIGPEVSVGRRQAGCSPRGSAPSCVLVGDPGVLERAGAAGGPRILEVPLPAPLREPPPSAAGGRASLAVARGGARPGPRGPGAARARDRAGQQGGGPDRVAGLRRPHRMARGEARRQDARHDVRRPDVPGGARDRPRPARAGARPSSRPSACGAWSSVVRSDLEAPVRHPGRPDPRPRPQSARGRAGRDRAGGGGRDRARRSRSSGRRGSGSPGPFPADSYFRPGFEQGCDAVVAWYHDQGLLPVKCLAFGEAVNVTLGLPIVRTSVDHGTAFDRAWRGEADPGSMACALRLALDLSFLVDARRRPACVSFYGAARVEGVLRFTVSQRGRRIFRLASSSRGGDWPMLSKKRAILFDVLGQQGARQARARGSTRRTPATDDARSRRVPRRRGRPRRERSPKAAREPRSRRASRGCGPGAGRAVLAFRLRSSRWSPRGILSCVQRSRSGRADPGPRSSRASRRTRGTPAAGPGRGQDRRPAHAFAVCAMEADLQDDGRRAQAGGRKGPGNGRLPRISFRPGFSRRAWSGPPGKEPGTRHLPDLRRIGDDRKSELVPLKDKLAALVLEADRPVPERVGQDGRALTSRFRGRRKIQR